MFVENHYFFKQFVIILCSLTFYHLKQRVKTHIVQLPITVLMYCEVPLADSFARIKTRQAFVIPGPLPMSRQPLLSTYNLNLLREGPGGAALRRRFVGVSGRSPKGAASAQHLVINKAVLPSLSNGSRGHSWSYPTEHWAIFALPKLLHWVLSLLKRVWVDLCYPYHP